MKKSIFFLILFHIVAISSWSQYGKDELKALRTFGIGIGFRTYDIGLSNWINTSTIVLPINLRDEFRFEPEFGFSTSKREEGDDIYKYSNLLMGLTSSFIVEFENIYILPGFNFGFSRNKAYYERPAGEDSSWKGNQYILGPVLGVEYLIIEHFSVGCNFGLLYSFEKSIETWDDSNFIEKQFITAADLKFRFYF